MTLLETWIVSLFLFLFSLPTRVETAESAIRSTIDAIRAQTAHESVQTMKYTSELEHVESDLFVLFQPVGVTSVRASDCRRVGDAVLSHKTGSLSPLPAGREWPHIDTLPGIDLKVFLEDSLSRPEKH